MTNTKKLIAMLTLLVLLLTMVACTTQRDSNTPTTDPQQTTDPTEATLPPATGETQPEETTAPTETEPEETEPQLQFRDREPDGTPLTTAQLQEVFAAITESDPEHWYETIFIQDFTDPREMNFFLLFGDGIPAERRKNSSFRMAMNLRFGLTLTGFPEKQWNQCCVPIST